MKRNFENEMWGKTLLSLYRHLHTMANSIDNLIKRIGINSAFNHSVYNSTIKDSNKIIELTERKIKIIMRNFEELFAEFECEKLNNEFVKENVQNIINQHYNTYFFIHH